MLISWKDLFADLGYHDQSTYTVFLDRDRFYNGANVGSASGDPALIIRARMHQDPSISRSDSGKALQQLVVEPSITVHHVCVADFNNIRDKRSAVCLESVMAYLFREYIKYFLPKTKNGWPQVALGRGKSELGIHKSTDSSDTVARAWTAWKLRQELSYVS